MLAFLSLVATTIKQAASAPDASMSLLVKFLHQSWTPNVQVLISTLALIRKRRCSLSLHQSHLGPVSLRLSSIFVRSYAYSGFNTSFTGAFSSLIRHSSAFTRSLHQSPSHTLRWPRHTSLSTTHFAQATDGSSSNVVPAPQDGPPWRCHDSLPRVIISPVQSHRRSLPSSPVRDVAAFSMPESKQVHSSHPQGPHVFLMAIQRYCSTNPPSCWVRSAFWRGSSFPLAGGRWPCG